MAEPLTPIAAGASGLTVAGISAGIAAALGVDVSTICWSLAGGWFGSSFAPKVGKVATVVQFLLASLISALGATVAGDAWGIKPPMLNLLSAGISMSFYALKEIVVDKAKAVFAAVLDRISPAAGPPKP